MLNIGLTPACETCLSTNCCSAKTTCANNFDCVSLVSCLALCGGDPALCSTCTQALPNGVTDAAGLCNAAGQPCQVDCAF
jgi:hypothetical protein